MAFTFGAIASTLLASFGSGAKAQGPRNSTNTFSVPTAFRFRRCRSGGWRLRLLTSDEAKCGDNNTGKRSQQADAVA